MPATNGAHPAQPPAPRPSRPRRKRGLHALAARAIDDVLDDNARLRAELAELYRSTDDGFKATWGMISQVLYEIRELRKVVEKRDPCRRSTEPSRAKTKA